MTPLDWVAAAGAVGAWAATLHSVVNARLLRRPSTVERYDGPVAVLLPLRNEAHRVEPCLRALLAQEGVPGLEILILDDGSSDGTADVVRSIAGTDPRVRILVGMPLPDGWLGKPYACAQLAAATDAPVLVFLDADVVLAPTAVAACAELSTVADLVTPYPQIVGQRLVQPLLQWSWLTFLPLRAMERSPRPSLAAAGGQLMVVRSASYRRAGGHAAVRDRVLEDVELARAVKRAGGRIALADGSRIASCRMYATFGEMVDGYTKSLWATPFGAVILLAFLYLVPFVSPLWGILAYVAGVVGRVVAARATGGRAWPDALGHPLSIVLFGWLSVRSRWYRRTGRLEWKGRRL